MSNFTQVTPTILIIVDYRMYGERQEEIDNWTWYTFGYNARVGMTLEFKDKADTMVFLLKWQ
jgi:hypothetical protein